MHTERKNGAPAPIAAERLVQIDSLRALAALSVVAFHYTTRYDQVFMHSSPLGMYFANGAMGVPLFFAISGFVIFMTIDRAKRATDFVVWRFSRLYPAYWAGVLLTWGVVSVAGLPGHEVSLREALVNLTMLQFFVTVPDVDGVYWSLQVELVFYAWMLLLWVTGLLRRAMPLLIAWVGLALAVAVAERAGWGHAPYVPGYFLLLEWIPWFAMGMAAYVSLRDGRFGAEHGALIALALAAIGIAKGPGQLVVAVATAFGVYAASRRRLRLLEWRPLVYVGLISYPLYLVHENVGFVVIAELERRGVDPWYAIAAAVAVVLALSALLHHTVEMPGSRAMRRFYQRRSPPAAAPTFWRVKWTAGCVFVLVAAAVSLTLTLRIEKAHTPMPPIARVNPVVGPFSPANCAPGKRDAPQVLVIVLGQSNAGSHAEPPSTPAPVRVFTPEGCAEATDPLPGTTGRGATIWSAVPGLMRDLRPEEIIIAPYAVESSRIEHWLDPETGLPQRLRHVLSSAVDSGIPIAAVIWQQGESDARHGTEARHYRRDLRSLRKLVADSGIEAPLVVAKSTWCAGWASEPIRRAVDAAVASDRGLRAGPDTDQLGRGYRLQGCHFNRAGRSAAARMWADELARLLAERAQRRLPS